MSRRVTSIRAFSTLAGLLLSMAVSACGQTIISIDDSEPEHESTVDLDRGLVAYFPFDETEAGTPPVDASGNGLQGTLSPNPPLPSLSVPPVGFANQRSLAFDGVEQLVDLGNPRSLDVSGNVTLSAWVRSLSVDGYRNIVVHGFRWMPNQELALRIYDGDYEFTSWNGMDHIATSPVPPGDLDNWHHLAGVYDGVTYRLYRDGELVTEHPDGFVPMPIDAPWCIGGRSTPAPPEDRFFSGLIDEVRIYGRALSADEVRALFRL
jgi:hypothetical protein